MDKTTFIETLDDDFQEFTLSIINTMSKSMEDWRLNSIEQILAYAYYNILIDYVNKTYDADDNFFEETTLDAIVERINNIMGSYLYANFS